MTHTTLHHCLVCFAVHHSLSALQCSAVPCCAALRCAVSYAHVPTRCASVAVSHTVLHCAALRCAVLCCAVLCCAVLCCAVLCCVGQNVLNTVLCHLLQHFKHAWMLVVPDTSEGSAVISLTLCEQIIHCMSRSPTSSTNHQPDQQVSKRMRIIFKQH